LKRGNHTAPSRYGFGLALLLLAAAVLCAVWLHGRSSAANAGAGGSSALRKDVTTMWGWTESAYEGGASAAAWSVRWDGSLTKEEADALVARLGLRPKNAAEAERQLERGRLLLWRNKETAPDEPSDCIILFTGTAGQSREQLLRLIGSVEAAISQASGAEWKPSFSLFGRAASPDAAAAVAKTAGVRLRERYEDDGTRSETFYTSELRSVVLSGGKKVNLQLAQHRTAGKDTTELIAGVPLITGDYSRE
jgi:hypothetical protein